MRQTLLLLILSCGLLSLVRAQEPKSTAPECPATPTLDALVKALDADIGGPANRDRTCLRQVLLPQARLSVLHRNADGTFEPRILTVDDWINAVAQRGTEPIYEVQVKVSTEQYGHFAHLWSTYEIRPAPDGKAEVTGINSIQAVFDGANWRVLSILWEPATTAGPLPEKYKP